MWICPVCGKECHDPFCSECGFDHSCHYEQFPTLQPIAPETPAVSRLRELYSSSLCSSDPATCLCCGGEVTGSNCDYCNFIAVSDPAQRQSPMMHQLADAHRQSTLELLTDFSVHFYRYVWVPQRSRLEMTSQLKADLGKATDFYGHTKWATQRFGQLRSGTGTDLGIQLSYRYEGKPKTLRCTIPTVKCSDFWQIGISIDESLHVRFHLGSGNRFAESAPHALELK